MKVLFTGRGTSGSWKIRGDQLGHAIGAAVVPQALDVAGYSVAVVVKRADAALIGRLRHHGVPIVWDVVDAWPQPHGNDWTRAECMAWLRQQVQNIRPAAIVAATRAMADDCVEFGLPALALPHHARPGLRPVECRPIEVVGYEGGAQHLGEWAHWLSAECERRGWRFVINPPAITECDVLVALRERTGYAPMHWKSNVKLANAQAAGVPIICASECGYLETASGAEWFADDRSSVVAGLDALTRTDVRRELGRQMQRVAPQLDAVAFDLVKWLRTLPCWTAAKS